MLHQDLRKRSCAVNRILLFLMLAMGSSAHSFAQPSTFTIRMTADNFYAVFTGTVAGASTKHFSDSWPAVRIPGPLLAQSTDTHLYVLVRDDGSSLQGFLATLSVGSGYVTTGSNLWTVCATNALQNVGTTTLASLNARILACNRSNGWRPTNNGPADGNAALPPNNLWGNQAQIDDSAAWIYYDNPSSPCPGSGTRPPFLLGPCDPGESLIFRISLRDVANCREPVPDFSIDCKAGPGALVANGTNSQHEQNHFWSIQESDQWWNGKGPEIMQWFTGPAGSFDLKAFFEGKGQKLKCDTYYRVKLALGNRCVSWRDTIRLVKVPCCPCEVISLPRP